MLGVAVWIGNMIFAHFCLRPALGNLTPQLRLPLWEAVFARFFNWVAGAVLVILITGGFLLMQFGGGHAVWSLHAMAGLGILMMLIFGHIRFAVFPKIRRAVQAQNWPDGARAVAAVRRLVVVKYRAWRGHYCGCRFVSVSFFVAEGASFSVVLCSRRLVQRKKRQAALFSAPKKLTSSAHH